MAKRRLHSLRIKPLFWILIINGLSLPTASIAMGGITQEALDSRAAALGWVSDPQANVCGGYYAEPDLNGTNILSDAELRDQPINITADGAPRLQADGQSILSGNVLFKQPGRQLKTDQAILVRDGKTQQYVSTDLTGNVAIYEPGRITVGDHAHVELQKHAGDYYGVIYRLGLNFQPITYSALPCQSNKRQVHGMLAQGDASQFTQKKKGYFILKNATYSTCAPTNNSWVLKAKKIVLNHESGRGVAKHAALYLKGIPVLYTPYFDFPIDNRRMSGFLMPTYSNSTLGGISIGVPYYWNLATNYDITITPDWYSKRGLQLNTHNRYLTEASRGEFNFGALPHDKAFLDFQKNAPIEYANSPNSVALSKLNNSTANRWYYNLKDQTQFNSNWRSNINYTRVSDDYYQQDFGLHPITPNQMLQQEALNYSNQYWAGQLQVLNYQTLHPVNLLAANNQYSRMPDLSISTSYPTDNSFTYSFSGEEVYFKRSLNPGEVFNSNSGQPTQGSRFNMTPGISMPFVAPAGYITPTLQYSLTQYSLNNQVISYDNSIYRALPIFNVDSGLYFDRTLSFGHNSFQQTLEPRFYYLYAPYRQQYQIPAFDSALQPLTFDQLFKTNRFSSIDRIGDANQFSVALTTRLLEDSSGAEKLRASLGRIYYRRNRNVMLCSTPGCQDSLYAIGATSPSESASPLIGLLNYQLNPKWSANSNLAWDPQTHQANNGNLNIQYKQAANHIINLGYNFIQYGDTYSPPTPTPNDRRNNLNQVGASFAWPLTQSIGTLASWNYNVSHQHFQTYLYGLSYDTCCYAVRIASGRTFLALNGNGSPQYNKQIYLQLVLKGLGGVGKNDAASTFLNNVPGYEDKLNNSPL